MASPTKLSHIVLQTNRRREMIDWYCTVLGAEILYEPSASRLSVMTTSITGSPSSIPGR